MIKFFAVLLAIIIVLAVLGLEFLIVQVLWNFVMAGAFGFTTLTYWQAGGLTLILMWLGSLFRGRRK